MLAEDIERIGFLDGSEFTWLEKQTQIAAIRQNEEFERWFEKGSRENYMKEFMNEPEMIRIDPRDVSKDCCEHTCQFYGMNSKGVCCKTWKADE